MWKSATCLGGRAVTKMQDSLFFTLNLHSCQLPSHLVQTLFRLHLHLFVHVFYTVLHTSLEFFALLSVRRLLMLTEPGRLNIGNPLASPGNLRCKSPPMRGCGLIPVLRRHCYRHSIPCRSSKPRPSSSAAAPTAGAIDVATVLSLRPRLKSAGNASCHNKWTKDRSPGKSC